MHPTAVVIGSHFHGANAVGIGNTFVTFSHGVPKLALTLIVPSGPFGGNQLKKSPPPANRLSLKTKPIRNHTNTSDSVAAIHHLGVTDAISAAAQNATT